MLDRNEFHSAAVRLDYGFRAQIVLRVVAAFDIEVRAKALNERKRPSLVQRNHGVYGFERRDKHHTLGFRDNRTKGVFIGSNGAIRVDGYDKPIAELPGRRQIGDVTSMQNVEGTAGEAYCFAAIANLSDPRLE
jgi:hypothetical protein